MYRDGCIVLSAEERVRILNMLENGWAPTVSAIQGEMSPEADKINGPWHWFVYYMDQKDLEPYLNKDLKQRNARSKYMIKRIDKETSDRICPGKHITTVRSSVHEIRGKKLGYIVIDGIDDFSYRLHLLRGTLENMEKLIEDIWVYIKNTETLSGKEFIQMGFEIGNKYKVIMVDDYN